MPLTEEVMETQLYDKVDEYNTFEYTDKSYRKGEFKEKSDIIYKIYFDFETITSEVKHMPYLCWIYNDDIQQEFIGIIFFLVSGVKEARLVHRLCGQKVRACL